MFLTAGSLAEEALVVVDVAQRVAHWLVNGCTVFGAFDLPRLSLSAHARDEVLSFHAFPAVFPLHDAVVYVDDVILSAHGVV